MRELKLADFGLETTADAAQRRGQHPATLRLLVQSGEIPAVVVGAGRSARYLVRPADVDAVPIREPGAPVGNQFAAKKPAAKKPRPPAKKGKK